MQSKEVVSWPRSLQKYRLGIVVKIVPTGKLKVTVKVTEAPGASEPADAQNGLPR
jgi:hypothetical protein